MQQERKHPWRVMSDSASQDVGGSGGSLGTRLLGGLVGWREREEAQLGHQPGEEEGERERPD